MSQTAKRHLGYTDGKERTNEDDPDGEVRRKVHTKQQTSQSCRTIENGVPLILEDIFVDSPLKEDAGCHTRQTYDDGAQTEEVERHEQCRHQGDDHTIHVALYGICSVCVWR